MFRSRKRNGAPRVVVVTGASAGVGRAAARAFGRERAHVGLVARGQDGLDGAKHEIEAAGGRAICLPVDVSDADAVNNAAETVEREFGPIDVWVNDAMCTVTALWLVPAAIAHTRLRDRFLGMLLPEFKDPAVEIGAADLGWFVPVTLYDVRVYDRQP